MAQAEVSESVARYKERLKNQRSSSPIYGDNAQSQTQYRPSSKSQKLDGGIYNPLFSDPFSLQTNSNKKKRLFAPWEL